MRRSTFARASMLTSIGWSSLLAGFATPSASAQQPWFSPFGPFVPTIGSTDAHATFADLDGDGRIDVVVARAGQIVLARATGLGAFEYTTATLPGSPSVASAVAVGRFTSDALPDLVYVDSQLAAARLIVANGNNTYAYGAQTTTLVTAIVAPQAVDIDSDGTAELAFVNVAGKLAVQSVAATGSWTSVVSMPAYPGSVRSFVHGDFDGDGDGDFVVFTDTTGPQHLRLLRANGGGSFVAGPTTSLPSDSIVPNAACVAVDVEQDGDLDLVHARSSPTGIQIARNDGTGAFTLDPESMKTTMPFAITDLDGDRDGDLISFSVVGPMVTSTNDGSGQFRESDHDAFVAKGAIAVRLAHVDGDDLLDAMVVTFDASAPADFAVRVLTAIGKEGGGFRAAPVAPSQIVTGPALAVGDIDTDGDLEAVRPIASLLEVSEWDGGLGFTLSKAALFPLSDRIELVDLNLDGLLDCVGDARLAGSPPFGIAVAENHHGVLSNGKSIFATKPAVNAFQSDFALGDTDGDGDLDACVVGWPKAPGLQVHALRQMVNQNGALVPVQTLVPATPLLDASLDHIATADADNDGDLDLFVGNVGSTTSDVALLVGDGQGAFLPTAALPIKLSSQSQSLRVIDVDGDGAVDVLGSNAQNTIIVLYGVGSGSFAPTAILAGLPGLTRDVRFEDFDDDGLLDAFSVRNPTGVPFVRQTTPRSFAPVQTSSSGTKLLDAVPIDLDGDGHADLVGIRESTRAPFAMTRLCIGPTVQVAHACAGSGGFAPTLSVQNCPIAGSSLEFTIDDALGGTRGFLLISTGVTPIPFKTGCALDLNFPVTKVATFATSGFGPGNGEASIAYPLPLALAGTTFAAQAVVRDPASPNQAVVTNAVVVDVE